MKQRILVIEEPAGGHVETSLFSVDMDQQRLAHRASRRVELRLSQADVASIIRRSMLMGTR